MTARLDALDHVFVLRFYREPAADRTRPMNWRARIREVNTRREFHTVGFDAACNIIRSRLQSYGDDADGDR